MPKVSKRAPEASDSTTSTLKVCPHCLGDLEFRGAVDGGYLACLQCGASSATHDDAARRVHAPARRHGSLMTTDALLNRVPS